MTTAPTQPASTTLADSAVRPARRAPGGTVRRLANRDAVHALRGRLRDLRTPSVKTPSTWADDGGLFYGNDGAWVFYQVPASALAEDPDVLDTVLHTLAREVGDRPVRLLRHGWEEPATVPAGLTDAHQDYLARSLRLLVPGTTITVGVQLVEDPHIQREQVRLRNVFFEVVDRSLGEWVPNLDAYAADRARIGALLAPYGLVPVSGTAMDLLEFWYTLGVPRDVDLVEHDDAILVRDTEVIELVSVRSFADPLPESVTGQLSVSAGGTLVVSVRGTLVAGAETRTDGRSSSFGSLSDTSIIIGRRATTAPTTLVDACAALAAVEVKPLPMRQIPALEETLPCSELAIEPHLYRVTAAKLRHLGFTDSTPVGDRAGVLVGMVTPDYAYPLYLDLYSRPGYTVTVAGGPGAGKTFLAEHVAAQTLAAGRAVTVVTDGGDTGQGLLDTPGAVVVDTPSGGLLDPFRCLPADYATAVTMKVVAAALPHLDADGLALVETTLQRAAAADVTDLAAALRLIPTPALAAQLIRFTKTPAGVLLTGNPGQQQWTPGVPVRVVDLAGVLAGVEDPRLRATLADVTLAVARERTGTGLTVADDVGSWAPGTVTALVDGHTQQGPLLALTRTPAALVTGTLPAADTTIVLSCDPDEAAPVFAERRYGFDLPMRRWLAAAAPVAADGVVTRPALGVVWDAHGRAGSLLVGPVPLDRLPAFTRGAATTYLADLTHATL